MCKVVLLGQSHVNDTLQIDKHTIRRPKNVLHVPDLHVTYHTIKKKRIPFKNIFKIKNKKFDLMLHNFIVVVVVIIIIFVVIVVAVSHRCVIILFCLYVTNLGNIFTLEVHTNKTATICFFTLCYFGALVSYFAHHTFILPLKK